MGPLCIPLNWSKSATITLLRFFYTRELSANIIETKILNELCEIALILKQQDIDFALTALKRKSLNLAQEKLNPFKVPGVGQKRKRDKEHDQGNGKSSSFSKSKNPFASELQNTKKPKKPKNSKNPFANDIDSDEDSSCSDIPTKKAHSPKKIPQTNMMDRFRKDTEKYTFKQFNQRNSSSSNNSCDETEQMSMSDDPKFPFGRNKFGNNNAQDGEPKISKNPNCPF